MRILYIYDHNGWAFENVGFLWLRGHPDIDVEFKTFNKVTKNDISSHDFIWVAAIELCCHLPSLEWHRVIVTVHDPCELFPTPWSWKSDSPNIEVLEKLRRVRLVTVTSKEMHKILTLNNIDAALTPTMGLLPLIELPSIITNQCRICCVSNIPPRKNLCMLFNLQDDCIRQGIQFDTKIGFSVWPVPIYQNFLDTHEIYVCTSLQEGGPITAMEAMARGQVVVSTPVGQLQEIIEHQKTGFICNDEGEFLDAIKTLSNDQEMLHDLRIASRQRIEKVRDATKIRNEVSTLLKTLYSYA